MESNDTVAGMPYMAYIRHKRICQYPPQGLLMSELSDIIKSQLPIKEKAREHEMKKGLLTMAGVLLTVSLVSAGTTVPVLAEEETTLVYGSGDYTRINPAMDEHGEINILIFNGLTAHDGDNQVVPGLAESWDFDDETNTYTFHMVEDAKWQDGEPVTAEDVKFTIEAIMDPENGSENAPNYEDVEEINVIDDHTVEFKLEDKNVAFLGLYDNGSSS